MVYTVVVTGESALISVTAGSSKPSIAIMMAEKINASIKLKNGPANMVANLAQGPFELKEPSSLLSVSSPSIWQAPPIRNNLKEYVVSPFLKLNSLGPIPSINSGTLIPFFLATIRWPSSWNMMMVLNNNIPIIILTTVFMCTPCDIYISHLFYKRLCVIDRFRFSAKHFIESGF